MLAESSEISGSRRLHEHDKKCYVLTQEISSPVLNQHFLKLDQSKMIDESGHSDAAIALCYALPQMSVFLQ